MSNSKKTPFAIVSCAYFEANLSASEFKTLIGLLSFGEPDNPARPVFASVETISSRTRANHRVTQRALSGLVERGIISRKERAGRTSLYYMKDISDLKESFNHREDERRAKRLTPVQTVHPTPVQTVHPTPVQTVHPEHTKEHTKEHTSYLADKSAANVGGFDSTKVGTLGSDKAKQVKKKETLNWDGWKVLGATESDISDFVAHRKHKRARVTQRVIDMHFNQLSEASKQGWSVSMCVDELINRNWAAFNSKWVFKDRDGVHAKVTDRLTDMTWAEDFQPPSNDHQIIGLN